MQGHSLYRGRCIHMKGILDEASVLAHLKYALVAIVREAVC
jgi:hypothetical protein